MRYKELIESEPVMELAGVKQFRDMSARQILNFIKEKLGDGPVTVLGRGVHGAALQIGSNVYKMWQLDSGYSEFVEYCLANQNNPFLPKFFSKIKKFPAFFLRHSEAPDFVNYVKMEKLTREATDDLLVSTRFQLNVEFVDYEDEDENGHLAQINAQSVMDLMDRLEKNDSPLTLESFIERLNWIRSHTYTASDLSPELVGFVKTLIDLYGMDLYRDMHHGNFMMRGGQLVILDPFISKADANLNLKFYKFDLDIIDQVKKESRDPGKPAVSSVTNR